MKIYVNEKDCSSCPFANEKLNYICGDAIANRLGLKNCSSRCSLNYYATAEQDCPLQLLEANDKEVRHQERCKIIKELSDFEYEITNYENFTRADLVRFIEYLKEKGQ